ncbi:WXG100 family type VII secretion target [Schaalia sp. Marseille-Q2122]|uniref:WXG100 family type VII secretion target n=1 Tax=Schaalia sp. Marseille-Q2122 TaxID=2736604 RepID=UPI00158C8DAB|nr:hypothetical protein [Schaalia sp. Marseille-Q2122]
MTGRVFHVNANPGAIASRATTLRERGQKVCAVADQMRTLGPGLWEGPAAQAFHERFTLEPDRWEEMGQAFIDAAQSLTSYAQALQTAQDHASECQRRYDEVQSMRAQHRAHPQASITDQPYAWSVSPRFSDLIGPDFAGMEAAIEADWQAAIADLRSSSTACVNALNAACANAPQQRSWFDVLNAYPRGQYEAGMDIALTGLHTLITPVTLAWQAGTGKISPEAAWKVLKAPFTHLRDLGQAFINAPLDTAGNIIWTALDIEGLADDAPRALGKHTANIGLSLLGGATFLKSAKILHTLSRHVNPPAFVKGVHHHTHLPSNELGIRRRPTDHAPHHPPHHPTDSHTPTLSASSLTAPTHSPPQTPPRTSPNTNASSG